MNWKEALEKVTALQHYAGTYTVAPAWVINEAQEALDYLRSMPEPVDVLQGIVSDIDEKCIPDRGKSQLFYAGYYTAIRDTFRVINEVTAPPGEYTPPQDPISKLASEQVQLDPDFQEALHEHTIASGKDKPSKDRDTQPQGGDSWAKLGENNSIYSRI